MLCECCKKDFKQLYRHLKQYSDECYSFYLFKYKEECDFPNGSLATKFCKQCKKPLSDHRAKYCAFCRQHYHNVMKDPKVNKKVIENRKKTCLERYGFDNFLKCPEGKQLARENRIRLIENQKLNGEPLYPIIGDTERICLDELSKYTDFKIIRNQPLFGYFPDGLISELKLDIEFDEEQHNYLYAKKKDKERDGVFIQNGYKVFRISKKQWLKNHDNIIEKFKHIIEDILDGYKRT